MYHQEQRGFYSDGKASADLLWWSCHLLLRISLFFVVSIPIWGRRRGGQQRPRCGRRCDATLLEEARSSLRGVRRCSRGGNPRSEGGNRTYSSGSSSRKNDQNSTGFRVNASKTNPKISFFSCLSRDQGGSVGTLFVWNIRQIQ